MKHKAIIIISGTSKTRACNDLAIYLLVSSSLLLDFLSIETLPSDGMRGKLCCRGRDRLLGLIYGPPVLKLSLLSYLLKGISREKCLVVEGCLKPSIF